MSGTTSLTVGPCGGGAWWPAFPASGEQGRIGQVVSEGAGTGGHADAHAYVLRLDPCRGTPLRGTICPLQEGARVLRFDGWIELMSAIETLRSRFEATPEGDQAT
jgi:hypothetical protein